jgi:membrane protein
MIVKIFKKAFTVLVRAGKVLAKADLLIYSSATAYFSLFAIPAILFILLNLLGLFFGEQLVTGEILIQVKDVFGEETAIELLNVLENLSDLDKSWKFLTAGIVIFFISSTTLFIVLRKTINHIWEIIAKPPNNFLYVLKKRGLALIVIFIGGVLALVSVVTESLVSYLSDYFDELFGMGAAFFVIMNRVLALVLVTIWFASVFKLLPDAKIDWKPVWLGSFITAILFLIGKYILGIIFIGELSEVWGGVSSIILLLLFIFYVSVLIYYGAAFIKVYIEFKKGQLKPEKYAFRYVIKEKKDE